MRFFWKNQHIMFVSQLIFHNFQKKKLTVFKLLTTTMSPLGWTIFKSILALFAIWFFTWIILAYKVSLDFYFSYGFSTQFPSMISKTSTLYSAKDLS